MSELKGRRNRDRDRSIETEMKGRELDVYEGEGM